MEPEQNLQICTLPPRPRGQYSRERFRSVEIMSNFYRVRMKDIEEIYIFKIKITPFMPEDDRASRKKLIEIALPSIKSHIPQPVISGLNVFSLRPPLDKEFKVQVDVHTIDIKLVKVLNCKQNPKMVVQFLNNGLRNLMSRINYVEIGRTSKYFNISKNEKIDNLMMFSGYKANFMELQNGMFLRVDTAKKIVRNQTVLAAIKEIYSLHQEKERDEKRAIVKEELIDKIIMTNYGKTRYYRIADLQFEEMQKIMIPEENLNIKEYYQKKYDIKIQHSKQPLIVIEDRKKREDKTYLIPELCLMTGIPDDFDQFRRKKISEATIKSADQRLREIQGLVDEIKHTSELNSLSEIGIKIDHRMEKFNAKLIPPPRLALGHNQTVQKGRQAFFNLFAQPIFSGKHGIRAGLIFFKSTDAHQITQLFEETSRKLEVKLQLVKLNAGQYDSRRGLSIIDKYVGKAAEQQGCNICLIIIPNHMKSQYKKIKENCIVHNRIICQIATQGTLRKKNFKSIGTKILLQMIAKRGNTLWVPQSAQKLQRTMLIGFDNCKFGNKNLISGVATINSTFSSIFSKYEEYFTANDKYKAMVIITMKLVEGYVHRNKAPPEEIVGFANSCSGDQIAIYHESFITPLLQQLAQKYGESKPKFTFVLANTKTNERFFQSDGRNIRNVPAGTIVSQNIVSKNYDFFMVSQFANKGSTVPNHYRVIFSDSKMEEGILQELIYSQCFNYVNWTGSIKVPGILQYAKKHVKFNTDILEVKKISEDLENKLYFI